jgi:hypothetical protein
MIGDPYVLPDVLWVEGIPPGFYDVHARTVCDRDGFQRVAGIDVIIEPAPNTEPEELGVVGVDSATVSLLDLQTYERFWQQNGPDRIGICTGPDHEKIAAIIERQFGLKSRPISPYQSEVTEPVSIALEREILQHLKTFPEYRQLPSVYFQIVTHNTLERLVDSMSADKLWSNGARRTDRRQRADRLLRLRRRLLRRDRAASGGRAARAGGGGVY